VWLFRNTYGTFFPDVLKTKPGTISPRYVMYAAVRTFGYDLFKDNKYYNRLKSMKPDDGKQAHKPFRQFQKKIILPEVFGTRRDGSFAYLIWYAIRDLLAGLPDLISNHLALYQAILAFEMLSDNGEASRIRSLSPENQLSPGLDARVMSRMTSEQESNPNPLPEVYPQSAPELFQKDKPAEECKIWSIKTILMP
ncbi:hypothetical protein SARC_13777, partial [Sphaeroforma arctica JP610]